MKKLLIMLALLAITITAYAYCNTDYKCMNDCSKLGYRYGFCKNSCSWCD